MRSNERHHSLGRVDQQQLHHHRSRPPQGPPIDRKRDRPEQQTHAPSSSAAQCHAAHSNAHGQSPPWSPNTGARPRPCLRWAKNSNEVLGALIDDDAPRRLRGEPQSPAAAKVHRRHRRGAFPKPKGRHAGPCATPPVPCPPQHGPARLARRGKEGLPCLLLVAFARNWLGRSQRSIARRRRPPRRSAHLRASMPAPFCGIGWGQCG